MVDKLFLQILNMSFAGGVVILFVLTARLFLNTYSDKAGKVPFWIETKDGYVISITEQFVN